MEENRPEAGSEWLSINVGSTKGRFDPGPEDGKYLLVHFWAPSNRESVEELAVMRRVYNQFGNNTHFRIAGLCLEKELDTLKELSTKYDLPWEHVLVGGQEFYDAALGRAPPHLPSAILVSPDHKILAVDIDGEKVYEAVKKVLNQ
jgi:hypothetical protein